MLDEASLDRIMLPIGDMTKADVRAEAGARLGLRTTTKPDSQDVCFVADRHGREPFLRKRLPLHPGRVVDTEGVEVGTVDAVELVTVGQRKGLGAAGSAGRATPLMSTWERPRSPWGPLRICSRIRSCSNRSFGRPVRRRRRADGRSATRMAQRRRDGRAPCGREAAGALGRTPRRVAPGQSVALYDGDIVIGGGIVARQLTTPRTSTGRPRACAPRSTAPGRVGVNSTDETSTVSESPGSGGRAGRWSARRRK